MHMTIVHFCEGVRPTFYATPSWLGEVRIKLNDSINKMQQKMMMHSILLPKRARNYNQGEVSLIHTNTKGWCLPLPPYAHT